VTLTEPETALLVEKPAPVQEVALADDHERLDDWPAVMDVGLAVREAVGEETPPEDKISNCCVNHAVAAPLDDVEPDDVPLDAIA
jgi:hypothetical protein